MSDPPAKRLRTGDPSDSEEIAPPNDQPVPSSSGAAHASTGIQSNPGEYDEDDEDEDEDEDEWSEEEPVRCRGTTMAGLRCRVTSETGYKSADPLREGSLYCSHHTHQEFEPNSEDEEENSDEENSSEDQEEFDPIDGDQSDYVEKSESSSDSEFGDHNPPARCRARTKTGRRCLVTEDTDSERAQSLIGGEKYCTKHMNGGAGWL
mmetsp:Transcript_21854/g.42449  ORF Transcript_21854/g.42449 Transcript_21854/m.42449 type:complete len:206 (+) Transcript_21854:132-749(+)